VGKTFAMLQEAHILASRGRDVVVAWVQPHGRPLTEEAAAGLERVPPLRLTYRGLDVQEMDLEASLRRHPEVALVDDLAHTNVPGTKHERRWQDVEELRQAGIEVWTTVNIQHVESLRDVVERVTGVAVRETVPDPVLDSADELTLADMTPEALRKRMRHGNIYPIDRIELALNSFFRESNLAALRELAIWYVVQHESRTRREPSVPGGRDRVLIVTSCSSHALGLIRRGARMGQRLRAPVTVLAVSQRPPAGEQLTKVQGLALDLGADFRLEVAAHPVQTALRVAREVGATHLMVAAEPTDSEDGSGAGVVRGLLADLGDSHLHVIGRRLGKVNQWGDAERPDPATLLAGLDAGGVRGGLRLYLGYAPGVGKTTRLLEEALRRQRRGADVVVAGPSGAPGPTTEFLLSQLKVVPSPATGGIDVDGILRSNPAVVCVDDLGLRDLQTGTLRYQQAWRVQDAGINVVATLGVIDLPGFESAREQLGRFRSQEHGGHEAVPQEALDRADEIELVDLPPAELRDRIRSGWVTAPPDVGSALQVFSEPLLEELRASALRIVATHTERRRARYAGAAGAHGLWPVQERIMIALRPDRIDQAGPLLEAGLLAARREDASLVVIAAVSPRPDLAETHNLERLAALCQRHGVRLEPLQLAGGVAETLVQWAEQHQVTEIFMPAPRRRRRLPWDKPVALSVIERCRELDVHILGERALSGASGPREGGPAPS
jgi:two-component system sensor histidine kinase KdpD